MEPPGERAREVVDPLGGDAVLAHRLVLAADLLALLLVGGEPEAAGPASASPASSSMRSSARSVQCQNAARALGAVRLARDVVPRRAAAQREAAVAPARALGDARAASCTRTLRPASASRSAAEQPVTPAPTIATSTRPSCRDRRAAAPASSSQYGFTAMVRHAGSLRERQRSLHDGTRRPRQTRRELELDERAGDLAPRSCRCGGRARRRVAGRRSSSRRLDRRARLPRAERREDVARAPSAATRRASAGRSCRPRAPSLISPGTAKTSRPSSSARSAVMSAPLRSRASTTTVAAQRPATMRLRAGKRHGAGSTPGAYSETIKPGRGDPARELRVRGRIVAVDAAAEHGDRRRAGLERAAVRLGVDAAREARDDDEPRRARARGRASARPTRRSREQARAPTIATAGRESSSGSAPPRRKRPGGGSWIARSSGGNAGAERARKRKPRAASRCSYARASKLAQVRRPAPVRRRPHEMRPRLGREDRERELVHARELLRRAVGERLGDVLGRDASRRRRAPRSCARRARRARGRGPRAAAARPRATAARRRRVVARRAPVAERSRAAATRARDRRRRLRRRRCELDRARTRHRDDEVEAVEQRARELVAVRARAAAPSTCTAQPDRRARRTGRGSSSPTS